jgi:hypothetical protein
LFNKAKSMRSPGGIRKTCKNKSGTRHEEVLPAKLHNDIFVRVEDLAESIHSNQTGAFPYTLQQGNRYVMIVIHLDTNYIFCKPMKNRLEDEMIETYQKIINRIKAAGLGLTTHQLNNEASKAYKQCICQNGMMHELVPPDNHNSNLTERAIQTFKHHFISILSSVDDKFPTIKYHFISILSGVDNKLLLSLWCVLLKQMELTVNLLRQSNIAPKISAFTHVYGQHDYKKKTICANRMCSPNPHQAQKQTDVGHPLQSRIQPQDAHGAPPMLQDICHKNQSNKSQLHSIFQAPINYQPNGLT